MRRVLLFIAAVALSACGGEEKKTGELITYSPMGDYPQKVINLEEAAEVTYISLEAHPEGLLSANPKRAAINNEFMIFGDREQKAIFIFDKSGKFVSKINRQGRSGEEYNHLGWTGVDFNRKELYIGDGKQLQNYDFTGNYLRTTQLDSLNKITEGMGIVVLEVPLPQQNSFFAYGSKYGFFSNKEVEGFDTPYRFVDMTSGEVTSLPLKVEEILMNIEIEGDMSTSISLKKYDVGNTYLSAGGDIYISDFSLDTIYNYANGVLTPFAVRDYPSGAKLMSSVDFICEDFVTFHTIRRGDYAKQTLMYDKSTGEITEPVFKLGDNDLAIERFGANPANNLPAGVAFKSFEAVELMELLEAGKLSGELKKVAEKLTEGSNPVIALIKFN